MVFPLVSKVLQPRRTCHGVHNHGRGQTREENKTKKRGQVSWREILSSNLISSAPPALTTAG